MSKVYRATVYFIQGYLNQQFNIVVQDRFKIVCHDVAFHGTGEPESLNDELTFVSKDCDFVINMLIVELKDRGLTGGISITREYDIQTGK